MAKDDPRERRRYRRIQAPVFCRPARSTIVQRAIDVSLGGARVYSDLELEKGEELKIELFLPDGETASMTGRVVWIERLGRDAPARFDVGLEFIEVDEAARGRLATVLGPIDGER